VRAGRLNKNGEVWGRPHHLAQRWITYRRRLAVGDLFLGPYPAMIAALTSKRTSQG